MSFFDDDPFESIIDQFFGNRGSKSSKFKEGKKNSFIRGEEEERDIDFIETSESFYLVFELPGYSEKEVLVAVKGNELEVNAQKRSGDGVQGYLKDKLRQGVSFKRELPKFIDTRKFSYTMRNGVLEIKFGRRR